MARRKQPSVIGTMKRLDTIDKQLKKGKITKKQHDARSKRVLKNVFVRFA